MSAPARTAAVPVALAAVLVLTALGAAPFDDPGEGMHAEIARELRLSHDPFALTLGGVRYVDKPPLLYVLIASAFAVFGASEWSARLPSALAALGAIGATAWLGARLLGARGGVLAGIALATSTGFFAYARYARPETLVVAAISVGFALALTGLAERRRGLVVAALIVFGAAGIAKDSIAAVAPPAAIGLGLYVTGQARPLGRWLPLPGVVLGLVLAIGWWPLAELRTPGFIWYAVVDNHVLNVAHARYFPDEDVGLGGAEFLAVAAAGAAPWVLGAGSAIASLMQRRAWRDPAELPWVVLALWAVGVLGVTALVPFRLPHYGLPAYPAVALLAARSWRAARGSVLSAIHATALGLGALACLALWKSDGSFLYTGVMSATDVATRKSAVTASTVALPPWAALRPLVGTTAAVLAAGAVALLVVGACRVARESGWASGALAATMLAVMPMVGGALALVATARAVRPVGSAIAARIGARDALVNEGPLENAGALEWYAGRRPVIVDGRRSVLGFGATLPTAAAAFWREEDLARAWTGKGRVWLVTARAPEVSVVRLLPDAQLVLAAGGRRLYVNGHE